MRDTIAVVLGGGQGSRLRPLTSVRSKPAVPLAGKYRLIDIPISNCINSGINRIYVLTQFLSESLHRHIRGTYNFDNFSGGLVGILAAEQTYEPGNDWYEGTADAVRKNLRYLIQNDVEHILILSGDQLYRTDFRQMMRTHKKANADVTIAAIPVTRDRASALGILRADEAGRIDGFLEKPENDKDVELVRTDPSWIDRHGIESQGRDCLASMGIYLFNVRTLLDVLEKTGYRDFGKEVFPASIRSRHVQVHLFDGYWEDIGTIRSFYEANLALAKPNPPFALATPSAPIYTRARFLPPTRIDDATVRSSLVADGCEIEPGAVVENSVIGLRCRIGRNSVIRDSILMGADYFENLEPGNSPPRLDCPRIGIGSDVLIEGAIVDKNCRIGDGVQITASTSGDAEINEDCVVRDGVVVVKKSALIADGTRLAAG